MYSKKENNATKYMNGVCLHNTRAGNIKVVFVGSKFKYFPIKFAILSRIHVLKLNERIICTWKRGLNFSIFLSKSALSYSNVLCDSGPHQTGSLALCPGVDFRCMEAPTGVEDQGMGGENGQGIESLFLSAGLWVGWIPLRSLRPLSGSLSYSYNLCRFQDLLPPVYLHD